VKVTGTSMDPRTRFPAITSDLLGQIALSLSDHLRWLDDHLEDVRTDAEARRARRTAMGPAGGRPDRCGRRSFFDSPEDSLVADTMHPPAHSATS